MSRENLADLIAERAAILDELHEISEKDRDGQATEWDAICAAELTPRLDEIGREVV